MPRKFLISIASIGVLLLLSAGVKADPIVITDGTATIIGPATGPGLGSFNLLAAGFSASGGGDRNSGSFTSISGNSRFNGIVTTGGNTFSGVFNGGLTFILSPFEPPDPGSSSDSAFVTTAFTMIGNLTLVAPPGQMVLFSTAVSGSGIAQITYARIGANNTFVPTQITYLFNASEPVPEPATLMLLGTGLAGAAAAKVRKRRQAQADGRDG